MSADPRDRVFTLYPYFDAVIVEAHGARLRSRDGRDYIDLASGQLSAALGHDHPRLRRAAHAQIDRAIHVGNRFLTDATLDAVAELTAVTPPGLDKVVLCSTGSEANELALRMARAATGRHEIAGIHRGYYGASHELMSLSEYVPTIKGVGAPAPGQYRLLCPDCRRCSLGLTYPACDLRCLSVSLDMLGHQWTGQLAALIVEPILGSAGIIVPPPGYFERLRALCDRLGALLIADEAQTGLGRTGRWFGLQHWGVTPDILVLSKTLGGGFPVAAVVTTAAVEERCLDAPLANMSSHAFDPFGSAIAAEVLRTIRDEGLVERAQTMGAYLQGGLQQLVERHALLAGMRGRGLMIGLDVLAADGSGRLDPMRSLALEGECLLQGLVLGYSALSGCVRILPPLTIERADVDQAIALLDRAATYLESSDVDLTRYLPTHAGSLRLAGTFLSRLVG